MFTLTASLGTIEVKKITDQTKHTNNIHNYTSNLLSMALLSLPQKVQMRKAQFCEYNFMWHSCVEIENYLVALFSCNSCVHSAVSL